MCEIIVVSDYKEANLITHGGRFHADDVMATVILMKYLGVAKVYRALKLPNDVSKDVIIYDIGEGAFDHHQIGRNGTRINGVPYASAGLVWREFGYKILSDSYDKNYVWKNMDKLVIQGIDAIDNNEMPRVDYPVDPLNISKILSSFNPTWNCEESYDEAFVRAVKFAEIVFDNSLRLSKSKSAAKQPVEDAIDNSKDGIMILNPFSPWRAVLFASENPKAKDIEFVVYPSNRGGYNWMCIEEDFNSKVHRRDVPKEWWGASEIELRRKTGIPTIRFCHVDGFIGGAETLEDTIKMVKLAQRLTS